MQTNVLLEVETKINDRLAILRPFIQNMEIDEYGPLDFTEAAYLNEVLFLEELLDIIKRS
ncbi:hypothetical protein EB001_25035 [bacterium]|nr:hypothetical protein [bacterium]